MLRFAVGLALVALAALSAHARDLVKGRELYIDTEATNERDERMGNPFGMLVLMHNDGDPVKNSKGDLHAHGAVIDVIQDGGNGIQDPPNADGTPGGDDSLAYGNFNRSFLVGLEDPIDMTKKSGLFYTQKYFIPYEDDKVYYLRLWEGSDPKTAPSYQNTNEYISTIGDQGGGMVRLSSRVYQGPAEVRWKFGPSVARPKK